MSLFIASLNSGSNGNCYYVGNGEDAVLVDAGISCREIEKRMIRLGLDIKKIRAVFISHEHSDHIRGLTVLSGKHQIPVYVSTPTLVQGRLSIASHLVQSLACNIPYGFGGLTVTGFTKFHDAADPFSFVVSDESTQVGVFTDLGRVCSNLVHHFKSCNAAFLESNYDIEMLNTGNYPWHLKKRIRGGFGHLSNNEALDLFLKHRSPQLTHLLLSHLSKNNNDPALVEELFNKHRGNVTITVASRYQESAVYEISGTRMVQRTASQLTLAF